MVDENLKKQNNEDIEKCRQDIQKAAGHTPSQQPADSDQPGQDISAVTPDKPLIPSFEDIIAGESPDDSQEITINQDMDEDDDQIDVNEISKILSDTGPVDIDNVFEDEQRYDLLDDPEDTQLDEKNDPAEMLADTDWQLLNEPSDNLDDVPMNPDDDNSLEMMVNVDDDGPLISKAEQDMLMAEFNDINDTPESEPEDDFSQNDLIEQIQHGLDNISEQPSAGAEPQETENQQIQNEIPEFDVYENILSQQRKQSSTKRQAPQRTAPKRNDDLTGTVGDIIKQTKADAGNADSAPIEPTIEKQPEPVDNTQVLSIEETLETEIEAAQDSNTSGIYEYADSMNQTQHEIIKDIVKRDIDALCV